MLTNNSFYPKVTLPTRLSNNHGTLIMLIDNLLFNLSEATLNTTSGILIKRLSDHQPYFTLFENIQHKNKKPKYVKICKQDSNSVNKFHEENIQSLKYAHLDPKMNTDPNICYNMIHEIIQNAKNKHIPEREVKFDLASQPCPC